MTDQKKDLSALRISREHKEEPGTSKTPWRIVALGLLLIVALAGYFLLRGSFSSPSQVEATPAAFISASQANAVLTASGYVVAQVKAAVASKGTGRLEKLNVEEGDKVRKGEIIAQLEDTDVSAMLDKAHADLAVAQADSNDARQSLERQKTLFASGLSSKAELDAAEARYGRVLATIRSARAAVRAAEVALENTRIRAPFDGTVLTKNADVGEVVAPLAATANSRAAVVTMADMSSLQVEADVSESNITRVTIGQPCEIVLDAYPERRYPGAVHKIVPTADRAKATVLTKVAFRERDERVLPEMSAKVTFLSKESSREAIGAPPKLTVPSSSVFARDGAWYVFRVREGVLEQMPVTTGPPVNGRTEILSGVSPGDMIVKTPTESLRPGMSVTVK
jgi:RND family efflux transporter MFP subunit